MNGEINMSDIGNIILNGTEYFIAGGTITDEIVEKLITVLRASMYVSNQTDTIDELEAMLYEIAYHEPKNDVVNIGKTIYIKELIKVNMDQAKGWTII